MVIREITASEKELFNNVAAHLTQSYEWGSFKESTENVLKVVRLGVFEGDALVNGFQISFHRTPLSNFSVGYLPRSSFPDGEEMKAVSHLARENNAIFVKLEPNTLSVIPTRRFGGEESRTPPEKASGSFAPQSGAQDDKETSLVLSKPTLPKYSFLVDLTPPIDAILAKMQEKTRYNIRLAEKHNVKVERRNDIDAVKTFFGLVTQTEKRQGFLQLNHPLSYYERIFEVFGPFGQCFILVATYEGQPLSAVFLLKFKDTLYYPYGGWSSEHRELMPNNLIHFEAIKLGKELGCKTYDMWGAYKEKDSSDDPWYGVYRFKQGFGGKFVTYAGPYDLVVKPTFYKVTNTLYGWRKFLLKLTGRGL